MKTRLFASAIAVLVLFFGINSFTPAQTKDTKMKVKHTEKKYEDKTKEPVKVHEKTANQTVDKTKEKLSSEKSEMNKQKEEKMNTVKKHHKIHKKQDEVKPK